MKIEHSKDAEGVALSNAFGFILRRIRQERGLSQESLGFESGYHRTYISLLERGQKSPSLQTIFKLSKTLRSEPAELIKHVETHANTLLRKK
jgi:transcriptional regulator with XRE-family HTH domain